MKRLLLLFILLLPLTFAWVVHRRRLLALERGEFPLTAQLPALTAA